MPLYRVLKTADLPEVVRNIEQDGSTVTSTEDDGDVWLVFTAKPRQRANGPEFLRGGDWS